MKSLSSGLCLRFEKFGNSKHSNIRHYVNACKGIGSCVILMVGVALSCIMFESNDHLLKQLAALAVDVYMSMVLDLLAVSM